MAMVTMIPTIDHHDQYFQQRESRSRFLMPSLILESSLRP